jgi:hypothetical protein
MLILMIGIRWHDTRTKFHEDWFKHLSPRVEAGKNTSTVIPASRKRRRKGNRISETVPADLRQG